MAFFAKGLHIGGVVVLEVGAGHGAPVHTLVLPANPDTTQQTNMRTTIVQTTDGIYVDNFGYGIQTLQLSGTSAWDSPLGKFDGQPVPGNPAIQHLSRDIVKKFFDLGGTSAPGTKAYIRLYNDVTGEAYSLVPVGNEVLKRSKAEPIVVTYSYIFVVLSNLLTGHEVTKVPDPVMPVFASHKAIRAHTKARAHTAVAHLTKVKQTPDIVYIVVSGDSLWTIAQRFAPKVATGAQIQAYVDRIARLNHVANPALIPVGLRLRIPPF